MRYIITVILLTGVWAAHAQSPAGPNARGLDVRHQIERLAAGKPLPVVVVPPLRPPLASHPLPALDFEGKPLLTSLQAIGDACSYKRGDEADMPPYVAAYFRDLFPQWIPFKFNTAWTIAPEVRDDLNADIGNVEPLSALQSWGALQLLVHSLTREQLLQATTKGIRFADLPNPQQAVMLAAFGRPVGLQSWGPNSKPGAPPRGWVFDSSALGKPIGIKGITTVGKLVAAAAKATGVTLKVVPSWADRAVFAGDAGMRTGDVLRILAFDLQGAWRKVGRTFLLAWDRVGLGAHNLDLSEKLASIQKAVTAAKAELERPDWNETALTTLGPDPGLPIGPTLEQTAESRRRASSTHNFMSSLSFTELTQDQQDALVTALAGQLRYPKHEPITRELLATATLAQPDIHVTLDVPGVGNVDLGPLGNIRVEFDDMLAPHHEPQTQSADEDAGPVRLPPGVRGIAPPIVGRAEWVRLLAQMKRKGLDTLYVPVFWDGQTLFPSKQFPALPTARGHDVLKEVLAFARKDRIHVIAVIHALAWRFPGSKVHWLTKRRDLVDVDALGRGRWDWAANHDIPQKEDSFGDPARIVAYDPQLLSDFVRPGNPEVKRRLLGLIAELRAYTDLDGVALAHWSRLAGHCYSVGREFSIPEGPPGLGFGLPDRAQFLADHGEDPVDMLDEDAWFELPYSEAKSYEDIWSKYCFTQDAGLANALLAEMEKGWPGRVQTFSYLSRLDEGKTPAGDVTVRDDDPDVTDKALLRRVTAPATLPDEDQPLDEATICAARLADFAKWIHFTAAEADGPKKKPPLRGVVLDLTASPDLLWDALALLPNRNGMNRR